MDSTIGMPGGAEILVLFIIFGIVLVLFLIPTIFWLLTLQKALTRCRPENRTLEPAMVWLMLIPIFNLVWQFLLVNHLSDSIKNEFAALGSDPGEPNPGKGVGLAMCILNLASIIPYAGALAGIAALVCWIIHWVKIAEFSARIDSMHRESAAISI